jgi:dihydroorotase-like cyclic amidohydrolase
VTFAPPVRDQERANRLWKQLSQGLIVTMGSDHGPVDAALKRSGESNIWNCQFGIPGAETMVPLMLNAVALGRITLERMTSLLSEMPARMYGLFPQKGIIQIGSDADFTIVDLEQSYTLSAQDLQTSCKWIPYEGWKLTGKVTHTILRGKLMVEEGKVLGKPGDGRFLKRNLEMKPSYIREKGE